ncbi:MAG: class I SAM-dependent methyltransferase [Acidobacteriota bacterium]|nr:class I SAM-dependent methyltransferase [Acidobacteriota bacterium]
MDFLNSGIGSAKDNAKSPVHNWYKFTAGFSYKFVEQLIKTEKPKFSSFRIFDPFAGCGTTLVSSQKNNVEAVGNEAQQFMYDVIRGKLNWEIESFEFDTYIEFIKNHINENLNNYDVEKNCHSLLRGLYKPESLKKIYLIRDAVRLIKSEKYRLFFNLALSQTLHKVSIHPIAIPYISRNKTLSNTTKAWEFFEKISAKMLEDTHLLNNSINISEVYLHDSRIVNDFIADNSCSICITSPPYLNNLDYGEVSKVHTHFYALTNDWNEITTKVRKKLVTGSTTHYREIDFDLEKYKKGEFYLTNKAISRFLIVKTALMKSISKDRAGKKSFDILTLLYFEDMYKVLKEIKRVIKKDGKAFLILGDSAPYGVFIPTTKVLGKIAKNIGFDNFEIHKIRTRGTKWKSLTYRHSIELSENVLILS